MEAFVNSLIGELHTQVQAISVETDGMPLRARHCFLAACAVMDRLKAYVVAENGFRDHEEEIRFFKDWQPAIHKELLYWKEVAQLELEKPRSGRKAVKAYCLHQLEYYAQFFHRHRDLYDYYRLGCTERDAHLFVRGNPAGLPFNPCHDLDGGPLHSTASHILASLMAYEEVCVYLQQCVDRKGNKGEVAPALHWTGSKAQFIELGYALHAAGVINGGNADVKQVFGALSGFFGIHVSNYYGYFNAMVIRKKDRTPFMNRMTTQLIQKMDERDDLKNGSY